MNNNSNSDCEYDDTAALLEALVSPAADRRRAAEAVWNAMSVDDRLGRLLRCRSSSNLVPILLRREILRLTSAAQLQQVLAAILQRMSEASSSQLDPHYGYCLAEIAGALQWMDCEQAVQAVTTVLARYPHEIALWIAVAERAPKPFAASGAWQQLPPALSNSGTAKGLELLVVAGAAIDTSSNNDDERRMDFNSPACALQPAVAQILGTVSQQQDGDEDAVWELLVQAAEDVPVLLQGPARSAVLRYCVGSSSLMAVQVVVLLLDCKTAVEPPVLEHALATCWNALVDIDCADDEQEWATGAVPLHEDGVVDDDNDDAEFAQALLTCLLRAGGGGALSVLLPVVERALNDHSDPRVQRAALAALECAATAVPRELGPHTASAMRAAIAALTSSNGSSSSSGGGYRVRYQAVRLLGVLCETTEQVSTEMLEPLTRATRSPCPRIAAMACQAVTAYCRASGDGAETTVVPYLQNVLEALVTGPLSGNDIGVKIRAVGAVASLAQVAGAAFAGFYGHIMPGLLQLVGQTGSFAAQQLAGSSLEAATIIGQALGDDNAHLFANDAHQILQQAMPILQQQQASTIPMDQLLAACARIASVLGEAYVPYIEIVLPHLLQRAAGKADVDFTEGDLSGLDSTKRNHVATDDDGTESMTVAIPGRGLTKVTINTTKIQEKAQAARAVYEHAAALGSHFGPFSQTCLDVFLPLVAFKYSAEIRGTAAQTLAVLFEAACSYGETSNNMSLAHRYLPLVAKTIANQIPDEDTADMEVVYALADSLSDTCRTMFLYELRAGLQPNEASFIVQSCMKSLTKCLERRSKITREISRPLSGEDERQELLSRLQSEEDLLTPLVDSVGYTLKVFREAFLPIFDRDVAPVLRHYLGAGNDIRARLSAVCLFDDCVEYCGNAAAARFGPPLVEGILNGLNDATNGQDADLKRAAIYGIAQIARYAPANVLQAHAQNLVQQLCVITNVPKEQYPDTAIYENAVSALASLILFDNAPFRGAGYVKRETVMKSFLAALPLREDEDEAKVCSDGLRTMVESGSVDKGAERDELARVMRETLQLVQEGEEIATPTTCEGFASILNELLAGGPSGQRMVGFANLVSP